MKRTIFVLVGVLGMFLAMPLFAEAPPVDDPGTAPADPPAAVVTEAPEPVAGLSCGTESAIGTPEGLGDDAIVLADAGGAPDCPVTFSNCEDVPGRKCGLRSCVTADLGFRKCRQPDGSMLNCAPGNVQQTTCDCESVLHMICCEIGECSFGLCGTCSGGSSSIGCQ